MGSAGVEQLHAHEAALRPHGGIYNLFAQLPVIEANTVSNKTICMFGSFGLCI